MSTKENDIIAESLKEDLQAKGYEIGTEFVTKDDFIARVTNILPMEYGIEAEISFANGTKEKRVVHILDLPTQEGYPKETVEEQMDDDSDNF